MDFLQKKLFQVDGVSVTVFLVVVAFLVWYFLLRGK